MSFNLNALTAKQLAKAVKKVGQKSPEFMQIAKTEGYTNRLGNLSVKKLVNELTRDEFYFSKNGKATPKAIEKFWVVIKDFANGQTKKNPIKVIAEDTVNGTVKAFKQLGQI